VLTGLYTLLEVRIANDCLTDRGLSWKQAHENYGTASEVYGPKQSFLPSSMFLEDGSVQRGGRASRAVQAVHEIWCRAVQVTALRLTAVPRGYSSNNNIAIKGHRLLFSDGTCQTMNPYFAHRLTSWTAVRHSHRHSKMPLPTGFEC
jgi:hypothetical protein